MDYGFFRRAVYAPGTDWSAGLQFDLFLSAFNLSDRVRHVYDRVAAGAKLWLIQQEYNISSEDLPSEDRFCSNAPDESGYCLELVDKVQADLGSLAGLSICLDSTGMLRPHLLCLLKLLQLSGVSQLYILYAEPETYKKQEHTTFSAGAISDVRPIHGFEGSPATESDDDLLIIGMGYDDRMIAEVAEDRAKADKIQLFGLPSLSADMYQQSVLRSRKAAEELSDPNFAEQNRAFAPANDPFGTASALSELVANRRRQKRISNLYLSPLGTKPQVIGFGLYHMFECALGGASIIFPFSKGYAAETGTGVSKIWMYTIEF